MEKAIQKAIEGGWIPKGFENIKFNSQKTIKSLIMAGGNGVALLDPLFWSALGKSLGWDIKTSKQWWEKQSLKDKIVLLDEWENQMHNFIDHLIAGKSVESFFEDLIT